MDGGGISNPSTLAPPVTSALVMPKLYIFSTYAHLFFGGGGGGYLNKIIHYVLEEYKGQLFLDKLSKSSLIISYV